MQLHSILYSYNGEVNYSGKYKNVQNYISGSDENGKHFTIFTPLSPFETPLAMQNLCDEYNKAIERKNVDPLILIPIFIHDFLCIHPFNDGNGRMSILLMTLLLYRAGYYVGKYISLDDKIFNIKDLYYDALFDSQRGWYEGSNDYTPFIKHILSIIEMACHDFENRVQLISKKLSAYEMVESAIKQKLGKVTKSDVAELCSSLSISAIEKAIAKMVEEGKLEKQCLGKTTYYIVKL